MIMISQQEPSLKKNDIQSQQFSAAALHQAVLLHAAFARVTYQLASSMSVPDPDSLDRSAELLLEPSQFNVRGFERY